MSIWCYSERCMLSAGNGPAAAGMREHLNASLTHASLTLPASIHIGNAGIRLCTRIKVRVHLSNVHGSTGIRNTCI